MTYHELVDQVREIVHEKDASEVKEHLAIQFNIFGEAEGAFYIEVYSGKTDVEPYEYYDHDLLITSSYQDAISLIRGDRTAVVAMDGGQVWVEGSAEHIQLFENVFKAAPEKGAAAKAAPKRSAKPEPKKTSSKKAGK